jgi:hypothetical protein
VLYTNVERTKCGTQVDGAPISAGCIIAVGRAGKGEQDKKMIPIAVQAVCKYI